MAEGLALRLITAAVASANSNHFNPITKNFVVYVLSLSGFSGTVDLKGMVRAYDGTATSVNVLYLRRLYTATTYDAPSVSQMSFTTTTGIYFAIVIGETYPEQWVEMVRSAGTITIDVLETGELPLSMTVGGGGGGGGGSVTQGTSPWVVAGNVAAGAADSGNPVKTGGKYNSSAPTLTNGNRGDTQLDINANTMVSMGTLISGESQSLNRMMTAPSYNVSTAAAAATTTIKSGAGVMGGFIIPTLVASGTIKIYDNTAASGTVLLDTYTVPATITTGMGPHFIPYPVTFSTGLTVVMTGTAMTANILYL